MHQTTELHQSYLLMRKTLQLCLVSKQMSHSYGPCWATVCIPKNTVIQNEAANVIMKTPTETEIGYMSSLAAIYSIMPFSVHLALSKTSGIKPLTICIMRRQESGVMLPVGCTHLTFGF